MTDTQLEATIVDVQTALTYLKEAKHTRKKVHATDQEFRSYLKIALSDLRDAVERIEKRWLD